MKIVDFHPGSRNKCGMTRYVIIENILMTKSILLCVLTCLCCAATAVAFTVDRPLDNPAQEARARGLFSEFRCVVCQSESVADSPAKIAQDVRAEIRAQIHAGKSDAEIKQYMADRYGDFILMRPPVNALTWPLWAAPLLVLVVGGLIMRTYFRREGKQG